MIDVYVWMLTQTCRSLVDHFKNLGRCHWILNQFIVTITRMLTHIGKVSMKNGPVGTVYHRIISKDFSWTTGNHEDKESSTKHQLYEF